MATGALGQLRKSICCSKNQHLSDKFTEGKKFLNFFILLNILVS